jgi:hypothetical protein
MNGETDIESSATTTDSFRYTVDDTMGIASNPADVDLTIEEAPAPVPTLESSGRIPAVFAMITVGAMLLAARSRRGMSN